MAEYSAGRSRSRIFGRSLLLSVTPLLLAILTKEMSPQAVYILLHGNSNQNVVLRTNNDVQVNYTGNVRYYMPFTTESMCPVDVKTFPFDIDVLYRQTCKLFFGSWGHSNESITFETWLDSEKIDLRDFYDNQEWQLEESKTRIKEAIWTYNYVPPSSYSVLELVIVAQRHSFYYVFTLVIPSTVITVVAVVGFHIPNTSSKLRDSKVQLGLLTLMSMSVILLTVVQDMPKFSYERNSPQQGGKRGSFSGVPLIGLYYFSLLLTIGLSTITTSLFVVLERRRKEQKPIPFLLRWLTGECCYCRSKSSTVQVSSLPQNSYSDQIPNFEKELLLVRNHLQRSEGTGAFSTVALSLLPSAFEHVSHSLLAIQRDVSSIRGEITGWIPLDSFDSNWGKVIRNLEMISLCFYISVLAISLALFFSHDVWYR